MARQKTGGRQRGTLNKATAAVKTAAQEYTTEAIRVLVRILRSRKSADLAKIAAARELLDRGHGRPSQTVAGDPDQPLHVRVVFGGRYKRDGQPQS